MCEKKWGNTKESLEYTITHFVLGLKRIHLEEDALEGKTRSGGGRSGGGKVAMMVLLDKEMSA